MKFHNVYSSDYYLQHGGSDSNTTILFLQVREKIYPIVCIHPESLNVKLRTRSYNHGRVVDNIRKSIP